MSAWKVWPKFKSKGGLGPKRSIYADLYIKGSFRTPWTPRVCRTYRTKRLAWAGLMAFYRNRFYEIDRWYKARIDKPPDYPELHLIDPEQHTLSLAERLRAMNSKDTELNEPVDIGLPYESPKVRVEDYKARRERRAALEQQARHKKLLLDVEEVEGESAAGTWPEQSMRLASHFGIFSDLFHEDAYFYPVLPLTVQYDAGSTVQTVHHGNPLCPQHTCAQPAVSFEKADTDKLYTFLMVNPDGNPFEENKQVLHWMISNIHDRDVTTGDVLCDYLQPLPFKGTGWHRMVFILFQQDLGPVQIADFSSHTSSRNLEERTFDSRKFYKSMEDELTPAGLVWFQCEWDLSCRDVLHHKLGMEMPIYEFDWPEPRVHQQEEYPEEVPFNLYLDRYRQREDIEEELLKKRLRRQSPFGPNLKPEKYPDIFWEENSLSLASWQHAEVRRQNLGLGKYKSLYENRIK